MPPTVPLTVVALADDVGDGLLIGFLEDFESACQSETPWEELPRHSLIVGSDLAGLSWTTAKSLAWAFAEEGKRESIYCHFVPHADGMELSRLHGHAESGRFFAETEAVGGRRIREQLATPCNVVAYSTHGVESCARGGEGIVLCGLRRERAEVAPPEAGNLACGYGHPCPRGPYPQPLDKIPANVLLQASCGSVRLGDRYLSSDYNLALAFLDGPGLAFVGPLTSNAGNQPAARVFLAAMCSGYSLLESTRLVNAAVTCSGIDKAQFLALGLDGTRFQEPAGPPLTVPHSSETEAVTLDLGEARLSEVLILESRWVALGRRHALALSIETEEPGRSVHYFYRTERDDIGDRRLRLVLSRFPEKLGRIRIQFTSADQLKDALFETLSGAENWIETNRLCLEGEGEDEILRELTAAYVEAKIRTVREFIQMSVDAQSPDRIRAHTSLLQRLIDAARESALADMAPKLEGPFWLTNLLITEYRYERSASQRCVYCGGHAFRKVFRHPDHGRSRIVSVCCRCGITADLMEGGSIMALTIGLQDPVRAGQEIEFEVKLTLATRCFLRAVPRLCTPGCRKSRPFPEEYSGRIGPGSHSLRFRLKPPRDMLPHYYFLKVLAGSDTDLAFASRRFFLI